MMIAIMVVMVGDAWAQKKKIRVSEIPERIMKLIHDIYPDATIDRAKIVDDRGEYDVYGTQPDSRTWKIDFNDWEVERIEEKLSEKTIPQAIKDALKQISPGGSINKATKRIEGKKTRYNIEIKLSNGDKSNYAFDDKMVMAYSKVRITLEELPASTREVIKRYLPGSTIKSANRKTDYKKVFYELDIVTADTTRILWKIPEVK